MFSIRIDHLLIYITIDLIVIGQEILQVLNISVPLHGEIRKRNLFCRIPSDMS